MNFTDFDATKAELHKLQAKGIKTKNKFMTDFATKALLDLVQEENKLINHRGAK